MSNLVCILLYFKLSLAFCVIFNTLPQAPPDIDDVQPGLLYLLTHDGLPENVFYPEQSLEDGVKLVLSTQEDTFDISIKHGLLDYPTNILVGIRTSSEERIAHLPMATPDKACYSSGEVSSTDGGGVFVFDNCAKTKFQTGVPRTLLHVNSLEIIADFLEECIAVLKGMYGGKRSEIQHEEDKVHGLWTRVPSYQTSCNNISGYIRTSSLHLSIVVNEEKTRQRRSVDGVIEVDVRKREIEEDIVTSDDVTREVYKRSRSRRQSDPAPITVEIAAFLDETYYAYLQSTGLTTTEEIFKAIVLKYTSTAALFGLQSQLGVQISLKLTYIEIWLEKPSWYVHSDNLQLTRTSLCQNTHDYTADVLVVHTKQDQGTSKVKGVAIVGGVCEEMNRCAVENTGILATVILAHEIGHLLGMYHKSNKACNDFTPEDGIMDSNNLRWNDCNRETMLQTISSKTCLTNVNVTTVHGSTDTSDWPMHTFSGSLAGQTYTDDQICEMIAGAGAWYRTFKNTRTACGKIKCVQPTDAGPVLVQSDSYVPGRYCGLEDGVPKACYRVVNKCVNIQNVDLPVTEVKQGEWSDYGPWSDCTVTCGTGVQFRKRDCTKTVPQNAPYCSGSQYDVRKCTIEGCSASSTTATISEIRTTTCQNHGEAVDETVAVKTSGDGQCEVTCTSKTALLTDGTPCNGNGGEHFCVQGTCQLFSQGQNLYKSTDSTVPGQGNRLPIVEVPAGSKDVQIEFVWTNMKFNYLEIWSNDHSQIKVLSPTSQALFNTVDNPVFFASTYWYFDYNDQYLRSELDTILSEPVVIQLYQKDVNVNVGIDFSYITPNTAQCSTGICNNGGTWDVTLCSCVCPDGYYGPTCSITCGVFCFNGFPMDPDCNCQCDASKTYGANCRCQYAFNGKNCSQCREPTNTLENNCRKTCKTGCGGLDCSDTCEDNSGTCASKKSKNQCSYYKSEKNCQQTCEYCEPSATPVTCP